MTLEGENDLQMTNDNQNLLDARGADVVEAFLC